VLFPLDWLPPVAPGLGVVVVLEAGLFCELEETPELDDVELFADEPPQPAAASARATSGTATAAAMRGWDMDQLLSEWRLPMLPWLLLATERSVCIGVTAQRQPRFNARAGDQHSASALFARRLQSQRLLASSTGRHRRYFTTMHRCYLTTIFAVKPWTVQR
jgi:hypothetical protein